MHQFTVGSVQEESAHEPQTEQDTSRTSSNTVMIPTGVSTRSRLSYRGNSSPSTPRRSASHEGRPPKPDSFHRSPFGSHFRWKETWRIPVAIVGLYLLALLCAVAHYCFFAYLDGRIISQSFMAAEATAIHQAYVTTISLLLVTSARAALVACIGTCYTQVLWASFRRLILKISLIEDLFQIQTNAFRFVNHDLYLRTPLLAAIAAFCWLVPIATVYPPSALIVGLQTVALDTSFNVTILHQKSLLDLGKKPSIALIWCRYYAEPGDQGHQAYVAKPPSFPEAAQNASLLSKCKYQDGHISEAVQYLISSSLISGELPRLNPPSGQNSSYSLEFWGTVLNCVTNEREVERLLFESDIAIGRVDNAWTASALVSSDLTTSNDPNLIFRNTTITHRKFRSQGGGTYQYYPCLNESIQNSAITNNPSPESISLPRSGKRIFTQFVETTCHPKLVKYSVIISHGGEGQNVLYSINEEESVPEYTSRFDDFKGTFEQFAHFSDAVALYTTFAANLNMSRPHFVDVQFAYPNYSQTAKPYTTTNGTVVQTCTLTSQSTGGIGPGQKSYELWPLSVFERRLRPADGSWLDSSNYQGPSFDSKMATELLINTTISALSLNERFDLVNGTESRSFNIYRFEHKLTFFLPYGLAFGLAIPIIALGLVALYVQNHGVSAMSGGFLQLLMTTTGRTEMEAAIQKGSGTLGGYENVSKELREVEVRFGELFDGDEDEGKELSTADLLAQECGQSAENIEREQTGVRSTIDNEGACRVRRAGFGTARDVRPLGGRVRT